MYAILDLETTGGKYNEEGITEVAIYRFDGHQVVDQFISLVNPERPIQAFVVGLTGINNKMLSNAPKFFEIAKRIVEITSDCILVAHNAAFDYRILQLEFDRLGYNYEQKSLCTVELAKDLLPDEPSYSLGKLTRNLGFPITDRHRASGDAQATVKLFKLLLEKDTSKSIIQRSIKLDRKKKLSSKLRDLIENVPSSTGVFYLQNENGQIIFTGKSRNMQKRLRQHLTSETKRAKKIQQEVAGVSYDLTGSELLAVLRENEVIRHKKPLYNKAPHRRIYRNQLALFKDKDGFMNIKIERANAQKETIGTFSNYQSAKAHLLKTAETFQLNNEKLGLDTSDQQEILSETVEDYNQKVQQYLDSLPLLKQNIVIVDRGRSPEERAALLIEDGLFKGYGYVGLNHQLRNIEILRRVITRMEDSAEIRHLIQAYLRTHKGIKIIELDDK